MAMEFGNIDLKGIIRRRKVVFLASFGLIFFVCLVVAFVLPPIYESKAMIMIENQDIPEDFVRSTITTYIGERLHLLQQRILSYPKLLEIVKTFDLYPELKSQGAMVTKIQKDITIRTVDVQLQDRRTGGRGGSAAVAFTLSYEHKNPEKAQQVTDLLTSFFVEEDQKTREQQAGTTTIFLEKELEELRRQVKENEERISQFKAININQLPGSTGVFQQMVFRLDQEIFNTDNRIRNLQEKLVYLSSQIANIDPLVPILTEGGKVAANPANRLKYLHLQLMQLQAQLSDRHPDILRLKSEIAKLEQQVGESDTTLEMRNRLQLIEKELAEAKAKYGDRHPDVLRLSREADLLEEKIVQQEVAGSSTAALDERSDNPGYMNIRAQIIVTESEVGALREQRERAVKQLLDYQQRLEMAPFIDEQFNALTLDYENAKKQFNEVANKLHTARIAQEMDVSERGQRFRIDYPATLPDKPVKPNRLLIILMGIVLGGGCAVLLAALVEGLDSSIKAPDEFESMLGVPVLTTISLYDSPAHKRQRWIRRLVMATSVIAFVLVVSLVVDRFVIPLSEVWSTVEDRLVEMGFPIEKESVTS